jgi:hypothetical protein
VRHSIYAMTDEQWPGTDDQQCGDINPEEWHESWRNEPSPGQKARWQMWHNIKVSMIEMLERGDKPYYVVGAFAHLLRTARLTVVRGLWQAGLAPRCRFGERSKLSTRPTCSRPGNLGCAPPRGV